MGIITPKKRKFLTKAVLTFSMTLLSAGLVSPTPIVKADVTFGFYSDYVWRGLVVNDESVLQSSITVTKPVSQVGFLSLDVWGNFDLTDSIKTKGKFSEIDLTASYNHSLGLFELETGLIHYTFPNTATKSTSEVYFRGSYNLGTIPLAFSFSCYYDFEEIDGFYSALAIASEIDLSNSFILALKLSAGYGGSNFNQGYFDFSGSSLVDCAASVVLRYTLSDSVSITAGVHYMQLLGSGLRDAVLSNERKKLTGNLSVKYRL